ncbi:MAG: Hsp20/alpha crystallin family protein [Flavobacteriales bacterium]|nr:Hsp20/alpha crystallin family protein [Flavobacteriales bacterium]
MSNLIKSEKNGSLAKPGMTGTFPTWSSWIDEMFNNDLPSVFKTNFNAGFSLPKVNISETDDAFTVALAAPGMKKDDFKIEIDNQVLSISSEMEQNEETESDNFTRREFGYSSFQRSFTLPESVDSEKATASYEDGILKLELPKKEEAKKKPPRSISIS